jgi:hypothetical protein
MLIALRAPYYEPVLVVNGEYVRVILKEDEHTLRADDFMKKLD